MTSRYDGGGSRRFGSGGTRMLGAQQLLERATIENDYRLYEKALASFDMAISAAVSDREKAAAERGKREAQLSYATTALVKRDFDLALSLVEPLIGTGREPEMLKRRIKDKMLANRISWNHRIRYTKAALVGLAVLLFAGWVNFSRYMEDVRKENPDRTNLAERVQRALLAASGSSIQTEFASLYGVLQVVHQSEFRRRYPTFSRCIRMLNDAAELMTTSAVQAGRRKKEDRKLEGLLLENLWVLNDFRHELASEEDLVRLRANAEILTRLDNLTRLLITYGETDFGDEKD